MMEDEHFLNPLHKGHKEAQSCTKNSPVFPNAYKKGAGPQTKESPHYLVIQ